MALKIALDASKVNVGGRAGVENYTYNLIKALSQIDKQNTYFLYFKEPFDHEFLITLTSGNPNFKGILVRHTPSFTQVGLLESVMKDKPDIFFTAVHTHPLMLGNKVKLVSMIHGLEYRRDRKSTFLKARLDFFVSQAAKRADKIIVPSEYTKKSVSFAFGVEERKIEVIPEGVSEVFHKRPAFEVEKAKQKYGFGGEEYLVSVSTIQPRKNYAKLIEAFSILKTETQTSLKLVICGKKGWDYTATTEAPEKFGVKNDVVFTDRVDDEDLPPLLSGAKAFVLSSLEEGFGLPLLEAMACETPCVVSNIEPFVETGQETLYYFDPDNPKAIKDSIVRLLNNAEEAESKALAAKSRATEFTWDKTARKTLSAFENIVKDS